MLHSGGSSESIPAAIESPLRKDSGVTIILDPFLPSKFFFLIRRPEKIGSIYGVHKLPPHCIFIKCLSTDGWTYNFYPFSFHVLSFLYVRSNIYPSHRALGIASPRCFIFPAITVSGPLCPCAPPGRTSGMLMPIIGFG